MAGVDMSCYKYEICSDYTGSNCPGGREDLSFQCPKGHQMCGRHEKALKNPPRYPAGDPVYEREDDHRDSKGQISIDQLLPEAYLY